MQSPIGSFRRLARATRHAPGLRRLDHLWNALRGPYTRLLQRIGRRGGVPVVIQGVELALHPDVIRNDWEHWEAETLRRFLAELQADDVFYDVGAHFGIYSMLAHRKVADRGYVVAWEPDPDSRAYLRSHLTWNGCERGTTIRRTCCGSHGGTVAFYRMPGEASGRAGIMATEGHVRSIVAVTSLDEEVRRLGRVPTLVKIDVEGGEWEVLQGARELLEQHRPRLFLSLHPTALEALGVDPSAVIAWLGDRRYDVSEIARDHEIHLFVRPAP